MQLKEVMTSRVTVIAPEATIQAAAEKMSDLDIGLLPVCEGGRLVGVVTDRDITVRAVAEGRGPVTTQVREVMTPGTIYGFDDQDVEDAARLMEQYQIRRLPVLNRRKQLVGWCHWGTSLYTLGRSHWRARCLSRSRSQKPRDGHSQEPLARVSVAQDLLSRGCRVIEHEDRRSRYDPTDQRRPYDFSRETAGLARLLLSSHAPGGRRPPPESCTLQESAAAG